VGGGKPKMRWHFTETCGGLWPTVAAQEGLFAAGASAGTGSSNDEEWRTALIDALQDHKTELYKAIVEEVAEARPGVLALMDEALRTDGLAVGICSAATRAGFEKVVSSVVGMERLAAMDVVLAGDDVSEKKPHPMIYDAARSRLGGLAPGRCVVVEDSLVGLQAAKAAGMRCVVTYTSSTACDFYAHGADTALPNLQAGGRQVTVADLFPLGQAALIGGDRELLKAQRDPKDVSSKGSVGSGV
jgi:HAD superfamily hydrolase (TIGR01509 family)